MFFCQHNQGNNVVYHPVHYLWLEIDIITFYRLRQKNGDNKTDKQRATEYMQVVESKFDSAKGSIV